MKSILIIPVLSGLLVLASSAADTPVLSEQELRALGPLPEDKIAETIKKTEYNPFAERQATQLTKEDGESEDSKIRTILNRIPVSGIMKDTDGRFKVLFDGRLLGEGDRLPKYLGNAQTTLQRVSKVTEKVVEFSWVEDQAGAPPRKVIRNVRVNQPIVESVRKIPGDDGQASGETRLFLTPSGETLQDEAAEKPPEDAQAIPAANNNGEAMNLNHRPTRGAVNRRSTR
jgi:hypothetical protein